MNCAQTSTRFEINFSSTSTYPCYNTISCTTVATSDSWVITIPRVLPSPKIDRWKLGKCATTVLSISTAVCQSLAPGVVMKQSRIFETSSQSLVQQFPSVRPYRQFGYQNTKLILRQPAFGQQLLLEYPRSEAQPLHMHFCLCFMCQRRSFIAIQQLWLVLLIVDVPTSSRGLWGSLFAIFQSSSTDTMLYTML